MPQSESLPRSLTAAEQRAVDYGIDLSLLEENLRLTLIERMRRHDEAVQEILELNTLTAAYDRKI